MKALIRFYFLVDIDAIQDVEERTNAYIKASVQLDYCLKQTGQKK